MSSASDTRRLFFFIAAMVCTLVALVGLFAYAVVRMHEYSVEKHMAAVEQLFAYQIAAVETEHDASIEFYDMDGTDEKLAQLPLLPYLNLIDFHQTTVSARGLQHLAGQPNLKALVFNTCGVADEDMKIVATLPHLESLVLRQTGLTDSAVRTATSNPSFTKASISITAGTQ
jgi:hypothetical protein